VRSKKKSLLIYAQVPNAEDYYKFLDSKVPENADIIITSWYKNGWDMLSSKTKVIPLDVFSLEESEQYLFTRIPEFKPNVDYVKEVKDLAIKLGGHPRALSYAADYINFQGGSKVTKKTFKKYSDAFEKNPSTRDPMKELKPKVTYKNLVYAPLCTIEKHFFDTDAAALTEILEYAAHCDLNFIAEDDIAKMNFVWLQENNLENTLAQLASLSLINRMHNNNKWYLYINPLVRSVIKKNALENNLPYPHKATKFNTPWVIKSIDNGQVLDNFGAKNFQKVGVWDEYGGDRQLWRIIRHDQGYIIKSVDNGQVLDNFDAKNSHIGVWEEYPNSHQLWSILKQCNSGKSG
jgi:hypothetical protein